jgi:hypothetical protein
LADWEDVADCESGLFAAVDKGACVEALCCDESLFTEFVAVGVAEDYAGEWCAAEWKVRDGVFLAWNLKSLPAWVMNNFFYDPSYVAISLCEVESAETGWGLVVMYMRLELLEKERQAAVKLGWDVDVRLRVSAAVP